LSGRLRTLLEPLAHPYPDELPSRFERWGRIVIVVTPAGDTERVLLDTQWNLEVFADWFARHGRALCDEELVIVEKRPRAGESISQALNRMTEEWVTEYGDSLPDSDEAHMRLTARDAYQERHDLRDASCGLDMPPIYIGMNHGAGEISVSSDSETWSYTFDMPTFCEEFHRRLITLIEGWVEETTDDDVRHFALDLLHRLRVVQLQRRQTEETDPSPMQ
jgi:hypothetical protein